MPCWAAEWHSLSRKLRDACRHYRQACSPHSLLSHAANQPGAPIHGKPRDEQATACLWVLLLCITASGALYSQHEKLRCRLGIATNASETGPARRMLVFELLYPFMSISLMLVENYSLYRLHLACIPVTLLTRTITVGSRISQNATVSKIHDNYRFLKNMILYNNTFVAGIPPSLPRVHTLRPWQDAGLPPRPH